MTIRDRGIEHITSIHMKKTITSTTVIIACLGFPLGQICAALISSTYTGGDALSTSAAQLCVIGYFWFTGTRQP